MTTLLMDKPKGGRGYKAPYETKQMRVPIGLEPQIQELINRYRDWIDKAGTQTIGADNPPRLLDKLVDSFTQKPVDKLMDRVDELTKLVDRLTQERNSLDAEVAQLHTRNDELNLEIAELREQLKPVDKLDEDATASLDKPVDKLTKTAVKLDNKPVDKLDEDAAAPLDKPVDKLNSSKFKPMGQRQLAKRLGVAHITVGRKQKKEGFINWSKKLDPDQISWRFDPNSKLFYPIVDQSA